MGIVSNDAIECEERGYWHCDSTVCMDCVTNRSLRGFISKAGGMGKCSYCGKRRKVVTVEDLLEPIMSGIRFAYTDEADACGAEKFQDAFDTYSLIHYELAGEMGIENEQLLDDLSDTMIDALWRPTDPYFDSVYDKELYSWYKFCDLVKTKVRYVFYKSRNVIDEYDFSNPVTILETVGEYVRGMNLFSHVEKGFRLHRGRLHKHGEKLTEHTDFGPPPPEFAKANRMSAEGISLFYAAYSDETALREIYGPEECATIGSFKASRRLTLINLPKLRSMKLPSIFDEEARMRRSPIMFLREFSNEISKKIGEHPSIEYVPTQIVTEYFRYVFESGLSAPIDGIAYNSVQDPNGYCVVLFMDDSDFKDDEKSMVDKSSFKYTTYEKQFVKSGEAVSNAPSQ